jgi:YD repeat-containing protein
MNGDAASLTSGSLVETLEYAYDLGNQLTSASDSDNDYAFTFDNLGRVLTVSNSGTSGVPTVVLSSAYDAPGNRTSLSSTRIFTSFLVADLQNSGGKKSDALR